MIIAAVRRIPGFLILVGAAWSCSPGVQAGSPAPIPTTPGVMRMRSMTNPNVVMLLRKYFTTNIDPGEIEEAVEIAGYHDAQRLQGPGASGYGPLVKIYTGPEPRSDADFKVAGGAVIGVAEVYGDATTGGGGVPAYTMLNLDNGDPSTRLYCVFLSLNASASEGSTSGDWEAFVRPVTAAGNCENPAPRASFKLDVRRNVEPGSIPDDYPPAIRFADDQAGMPAIGAPCGRGWCEMRKGLGAGRPPGTPGGKAGTIKAWHDQQFLGIPMPTPAVGVQRSAVEASITPVADLASKPSSYFEAPDGGKVATVRTTGVPTGAKYATWKLKAGATGRDLYIRKENGRWSARFVDEGTLADPSAWLEVDRTAHANAHVPGVARWLWNEYDEDIWVSCEQGCCEVSGTLFSLTDAPSPAVDGGRQRRRLR